MKLQKRDVKTATSALVSGIRYAVTYPARIAIWIATAWAWIFLTSDKCDVCYIESAGMQLVMAKWWCRTCYGLACGRCAERMRGYEIQRCCDEMELELTEQEQQALKA